MHPVVKGSWLVNSLRRRLSLFTRVVRHLHAQTHSDTHVARVSSSNTRVYAVCLKVSIAENKWLKEFDIKPYRRRERVVQSYSPVAANVHRPMFSAATRICPTPQTASRLVHPFCKDQLGSSVKDVHADRGEGLCQNRQNADMWEGVFKPQWTYQCTIILTCVSLQFQEMTDVRSSSKMQNT